MEVSALVSLLVLLKMVVVVGIRLVSCGFVVMRLTVKRVYNLVVVRV